ncbi:MAG: MAPEG family protein [Polaromonas sp.]|uniref:MAPEG family protein n=1 Tax=Polaromonas sp. TaxID=1869339 RepID=UPI002733979B|nr:MAPEG family protein [Polaromonas sp.]MDP2820476.1 MAPEG family protein [Polaromonas sp.]
MKSAVSAELLWLATTCLMTGLLWIPYVINRFRELGPPGWRWYPPPDPPPRAAWADRAQRAHANAVENLVVFAPLVLAVNAAGLGSASTVVACQVYFVARAAHYAVGIGGLPIIPRTMSFLAGLGSQLTLAGVLLRAL